MFQHQVSATDDQVTNVEFSLGGANSDRFDITPTGPTTADIFMNGPLSRDYPDGHDPWLFNVVANDNNNNPQPLNGYAQVELSLEDINDNAPLFDTCCLVGYVPEGSGPGKSFQNTR